MMNYNPFKNLGRSSEEVRQENKKQAEEDLANGLLRRKTFGLIRSPDLLQQAYKEKGIEVSIIAGDNVFDCITSEAEGYNGVMDLEIEKRFGPNWWKEIRQRHYELRLAREKANPGSTCLFAARATSLPTQILQEPKENS